MPRRPGPQRGYALLFMIIILVMGSLYGVVSQLDAVTQKYGHSTATMQALALAKEALIGYAATYRDNHQQEVFGYLLCPDTDGDGDGDAMDNCGSQDETVVGLLPFRTLGLPDLRDADGNCLWYAVGHYKNDPKTAIMNWDSRGQFKILDQDGTTVLADPTDAAGGAVAVIFAPGAALSGSRTFDATKPCAVPGSSAWNAYLEAVALDSNGRSTVSPLVVQRGTSGDAANNDNLAWITPKEIWDRIKTRTDRGGINNLADNIKAGLEAKIFDDLRTTGSTVAALPSNALTAPGSPAYTGHVGELPTTLSTTADYTAYVANWKEQYRYAVCSDLCGYCMNIGGESCDGALLFGAAHTSGGPRTSHPTTLADLFENDGTTLGDGKGALPLLSRTSSSFTGASTYSSGYADVGICLSSRSKTLTSRCDTGTLTSVAPDFGGGRSLVSINTTAGTITLGKPYSGTPPAATANLFGCAWSGSTFTFGTGLRAYFSFAINNTGEGFTFSIIDAEQNPGGTSPCGRTGGRLGYSGDNGVSDPIDPPKIGLEIDTRSSTGDGITGSFGDPSATKHAAIVFWGTVAGDDDNTHGAAADNANYPSNPDNRNRTPSSTGVSTDIATLITGTAHVRLDIVRNYDTSAKTGSYSIKAWITNTTDAATLVDLRNTAVDFTATTSGMSGGSLATPTVSHDATTANLPVGDANAPEALRTIRLGFTNAQSSSRDQEIVISDLITRIR